MKVNLAKILLHIFPHQYAIKCQTEWIYVQLFWGFIKKSKIEPLDLDNEGKDIGDLAEV